MNATIIMKSGTTIGPFPCAEDNPEDVLLKLMDGNYDSFNAIVWEMRTTYYKPKDVSVVNFEIEEQK